jgi:hypothetical protein
VAENVPVPLRGVADLIPFLAYLDDQRIHYALSRHRDDTVMVTFTVVGARVEVDFFDDHIEFSTFKGNEDVERDPAALYAAMREGWDIEPPASG